MNYRHAYHAGNFADVIKHIILIAIIQSMQRKPAPFCCIDTHAGSGLYDLFAAETQKKKEYQHGIMKIIQADNPPPLIQSYLNCVHEINNELLGAHYATLRYYPGSPFIAAHLAREQDRIIACELQQEEYQHLKKTFLGNYQIAIHHQDGFQALKAFLPPETRRGVILIDPPYEDTNEYDRILQTLPIALKRFAQGVYALWYPIKAKSTVEHFYERCLKVISAPMLITELTIFPDLPQHLNGSGVLIINPPWQLSDSIQAILPWVWNALTINGQGAYRSFFLNNG